MTAGIESGSAGCRPRLLHAVFEKKPALDASGQDRNTVSGAGTAESFSPQTLS
jgi:hypothetical protein